MRSLRLVLELLVVLAASAFGATSASAVPAKSQDSAPAEARVLNVHFEDRAVAGAPAVLRVRVKDPAATVNGVQVDFGDGQGRFATSACRPGGRAAGPASETFEPGRIAEFVVAHSFALPGTYSVKVTATSGDCVTGPLATKHDLRVKVHPALGKDLLPVKAETAQAATCLGAGIPPTAATRLQAKNALRCLINGYRASKGLSRLAANSKLTRAAKLHSDDMLRQGYFAHESPTGVDLVDRLRRARYRPAAAGENIAAGTDALATPLAVFLGWIDSPAHNENMLGPHFKEAGIGVALGFPGSGPGDGATYTMTFGRRS
jgi:uncharacterized protein YkwD